MKHEPREPIQRLSLGRATVAERRLHARLRGSGLPTRDGATALARRAFDGNVHVLCRGRRTMACAITSLFLIAMFGIVAAGVAFLPSAKEKPSARRQETPVAPSGDRMIA
jgi:hypothetical protein